VDKRIGRLEWMPKSDILAGGLMLLGVAFAYFLGGFVGASIAFVLGSALLIVYYFMWRSERGDESLHVVEPNPAAPEAAGVAVVAPLICPEKYLSVKPGSPQSAIVFVNDSTTVAYEITIEPVIFDGWKLSIEDIPRIGAGDRGQSNLLVSGQNSTSDLSWVLGLWHKAHMKKGIHGVYVDLPPLQMQIRYRDGHKNWHVSICELWRNANDPLDSGVHLKLVDHHPIPTPPIAGPVRVEVTNPKPLIPVLENRGVGNIPPYFGNRPFRNLSVTPYILGVQNTQTDAIRVARNVRATVTYEHDADAFTVEDCPWAVFSVGQLLLGFCDRIDLEPGAMQKLILAVAANEGNGKYSSSAAKANTDNGLYPTQPLQFGLWRLTGHVSMDSGNPIDFTASFRITELGDLVALCSPGEGMSI
jgi:hypothetical protein